MLAQPHRVVCPAEGLAHRAINADSPEHLIEMIREQEQDALQRPE